jgi:hypothetical protein
MRHFARLAVSAALVLAVMPRPAAAQTKTDDYAWAEACKDCHKPEYTAWEKTKHARAITRLSGSEKDAGGACIGCHTTAVAALLDHDVNANVQCESCHGPGKAHIAAAAGGAAKPGNIVRKPAESTCTGCHSEKSPHFKFFSYAAMSGLVHIVQK